MICVSASVLAHFADHIGLNGPFLLQGEVMTPHTPLRRSRLARISGFTLVELLVVIGIIAVLIGILLPSLSKARSAANKVKCATALAQIGQGFMLYYNDYNQYIPPALFHFQGGPYTIGDDTIATNTSIYWFNFISPEVNAANMGLSTSNGGASSQARKRNVLWGCPAFTGYVRFSLAAGDDINRTQPGYGMNAFLLYQDDSDLTYDPIGGTGPAETGYDQNILTMDATGKLTGTSNQWFKVSQIRTSANRGLVADCRFWLWESASPGAGPSFPQNITQQPAVAARLASTAMVGRSATTCSTSTGTSARILQRTRPIEGSGCASRTDSRPRAIDE